MKKVLVVAPHPDDETLGCAGTLLKHRKAGDKVYWLIMTEVSPEAGFSADKRSAREKEIAKVTKEYGFEEVFRAGFPSTHLDRVSKSELVGRVGEIFRKVSPEVVYLPHRGDTHSDHPITFDTVAACTKWFRYPSVKRVLAYETLSETDAGLNPKRSFRPNVFVDISAFVEKKISIMKLYAGEMQAFPFPRSEEAIRALSAVRGSTAGFKAAEAFALLRERQE